MNEEYLKGAYDYLGGEKEIGATYEKWVSAISNDAAYKKGMYDYLGGEKEIGTNYDEWDGTVFGKKKESSKLVSTPSQEFQADGTVSESSEQPTTSVGKEIVSKTGRDVFTSSVQTPEEKEIIGSAYDQTANWFKGIGGTTPFEKMEQAGVRLKELEKQVTPESIANMSKEDIDKFEQDYRDKASAIVTELGLNVDNEGNISVPENERKLFEEKLASFISTETKGREKEAGFFENMVKKLAAGQETFSANTLDMFGTLTGLNNIKSFKTLSEGSRLRAEQLSSMANRYDKSIEESVMTGDLGAAAGAAVSGALESLPSMIPVFANPSYGLYAMSAMSGIDKYRQIEDKDIPEWKKVYNAFITGASEYAGEKLVTIPILSRSKQALLSLGETRGKAAIEQAVKKTMESNASKLGAMPEWVAEGMSEVATGISTDLVDKVTINPDTKIGASAGDNFVVGAVMGKMFALPQDISNVSNRQAARKFAKEVVDKLPADMDIETKINVAWKIAERNSLVNAEDKLDDKFKGKYQGRIVALNTEIDKEVERYSKAQAKPETEEKTVGKTEDPTPEMQQQLDYLKERGVEIPDGTNAEELGNLYEKEVAKQGSETQLKDEVSQERQKADEIAEVSQSEIPTEPTAETAQPKEVVSQKEETLATEGGVSQEELNKEQLKTEQNGSNGQEVQERTELLGKEPEKQAEQTGGKEGKGDQAAAAEEVGKSSLSGVRVKTEKVQKAEKKQPQPAETEKVEAGGGVAKTIVAESEATPERVEKGESATTVFEVLENEGKYKITNPAYKRRTIANFVYSYLDVKAKKEYDRLRDAADSYTTKEKAEESLVKLRKFEADNKSAFDNAMREIDDIYNREEKASKEHSEIVALYSKTSNQLGKLTQSQLDLFSSLVGKKIQINHQVSEAYHKAKKDGSNTELVKAVEELLSPRVTPADTSNPVVEPLSPGKVVSVPPKEKVAEKGEKQPIESPALTPEKEGVSQAKEPNKSIKPKNISDVEKAGVEIFGLPKDQAKAQAIIVDKIVEKIAKRRGVTKEKVYSEIEFRKGLSDEAQALFQAVWHGSPYEFDKFRLDKIGTGEGAKAFGYGLYFTEKKDIAEYYASINYNKDRSIYLNNPMFTSMLLPNGKKAYEKDAYDLLLSGKSMSETADILEDKYPSESDIRFDMFLSGLRDAKTKIRLPSKLSDRNVYRVKLHGDKPISNFNYIRWDKPLTKQQAELLGEKYNEKYDEFLKYRDSLIEKYGSQKEFSKNKSASESDKLDELRDAYLKEGLQTITGKELYEQLSATLGSDKNASEYLLSIGIDGVKYPTEITRKGTHEESFNYVIFDENVAEIEDHIKFQNKGQGAKGAIQFLEDGRAIISAMTDPNVSTPLHEIAHLYEKYMTASERNAVLSWAKHKEWTTATSEKFARGFEKYLAEGKAPNEELKKVFEKFKKWLTDIYNGIVGSEIDLQLNEAMRGVYASMLGEDVFTKNKRPQVREQAEVVYKKAFDEVDNLLFQMESVPKTIEVDGKQRPTTNSNGQQIHPTLEGIKNFWKWFGDSNVVDKDGRPLVVYHGTKEQGLREFSLTRDIGFHFAVSKKIASDMAGKYEDEYGFTNKIEPIEVYLSIQNLAWVEDLELWKRDNLRKFAKSYNDYAKDEGKELFEVDDSKTVLDNLKRLAFLAEEKTGNYKDIDGFAYINEFEGRYTKEPKKTYIVFNSNQIKSATGNVGTFDEKTGNILYQDEDKTERHTLAINKLIDNFEKENEGDVAKAVRDYLGERGNPVSEEIVNNVLKERGYAKTQQGEQVRVQSTETGEGQGQRDSDMSEIDRTELQNGEKAEEKVRQFGKKVTESTILPSDIKETIKKNGIGYVPRGRKVTKLEARELIRIYSEEGGMDRVKAEIFNPSILVQGDTRIVMAVAYVNDRIERSKTTTDPQLASRYRADAAEVLDFYMNRSTGVAQELEGMKVWKDAIGENPEFIRETVRSRAEKQNAEFYEQYKDEIADTKKIIEEYLNSDEFKKKYVTKPTKETVAERKQRGISKIASGVSKLAALRGVKFQAVSENDIKETEFDALKEIASGILDVGVASVEELINELKVQTRKFFSPSEIERVSKRIISETDAANKLQTRTTRIKLDQKDEKAIVDKLYKKMTVATRSELKKLLADNIELFQKEGSINDRAFKELIAKALGRFYVSDKQLDSVEKAAKKINDVKKIEDNIDNLFTEYMKAVDEKDQPRIKQLEKDVQKQLKELKKAALAAGIASSEIGSVFADSPTLVKMMATFIQGNLLTPSSLVVNLTANTLVAPARMAKNMVASFVDSLFSTVGDASRNIGLRSDKIRSVFWRGVVKKMFAEERTMMTSGANMGLLRGFGSGGLEGIKQLWLGQSQDDISNRDISKTLHPFMAWYDLYQAARGEEKLRMKEVTQKFVEGTLGMPPEAMFRLLNLGDKPFRRAAEQSRLTELADIKKNGIIKDYLSRLAETRGMNEKDKKSFIEKPDKESAKEAETYFDAWKKKFLIRPDEESWEEARKAGLLAVYQNDNVLSDLLKGAVTAVSKVKTGVDTWDRAIQSFFRLLFVANIPFIKTPTNVMLETLDYAVPVIPLIKAIAHDLPRGDRRSFSSNMGKAVVGAMINEGISALFGLGILGLASGGGDDEPKEPVPQKVKGAEYYYRPSYYLNNRALNDLYRNLIYGENNDLSWRSGDKMTQYTRYGLPSAIFMAHAQGYRGMLPEEIKDLSFLDKQALFTMPAIRAGLDQSYVKSVSALLNALKGSEYEQVNYFVGLAKAAEASAIPNTFRAYQQAKDNMLRETSEITLKGKERILKTIQNDFNASYDMGKMPPPKVDIWGGDVERYQDNNNPFVRLFDIQRGRSYGNGFGIDLFNLYLRTQNSDVLPPDIPNRVRVLDKDVKVDGELYREMVKYAASANKRDIEALIESDEFKKLSDDKKVDILSYTYAGRTDIPTRSDYVKMFVNNNYNRFAALYKQQHGDAAYNEIVNKKKEATE